MSGEYSIDTEGHRTSETVKEILEKFGVDEKAAIEMIAFFNVFMLARQEKWRANTIKIYRGKAEEMYALVKILKNVYEKSETVEKLEKKVLEMIAQGADDLNV